MGRNALVWTYRICLILGAAFVALGLGLLFVLPVFLTNEVAKEDYLGRGDNGTYNQMFKKWQKPEYTMLFEVWAFDVENAADVIAKSTKPHLREKGPYVFVETQEKKWFQFEQNDTRILYRNDRQYAFSPSLSCDNCSLSDKVTVPNILFQKLVDAALTGRLARFAIEEALKIKGETAFITVTVGELLFEGYKDPLVSSVCDHDLIRPICQSFGVPDRIGLFFGQNNTDDGVYEVDTGLNGANDIGRVFSWNNMTELTSKYWYGKQARMINGTDGQLFKPQLQSGEQLTVFTGQICRSIFLDHNGGEKIQGVPVYRYSPSQSMNDVELQRAMGFCNPNSPIYFNDTSIQPKGCAPSGLMDIGSCVPASPRIYVSQPMFLDAPPALRDAVTGLRELSEDYRTYVDIEPVSGVVVQALRRSQLNVGVLHGNLDMLKNLANTIVPIIWLNETALFDQDTRDQLHRLTTVSTTANVISGVLIIFGVLLIVAAAGACALDQIRKKREVAEEPDAQEGGATEEQEREPLVPPPGYDQISAD